MMPENYQHQERKRRHHHRSYGHLKGIKGNYEQYVNKFNNLDEIVKLLKNHKFPNQTNEIENLNSCYQLEKLNL